MHEKKDISVKLITHNEITTVLPLVAIINPSLSTKKVAALLEEMFVQGYQCVIAFYEDQCSGVIGLWIQTKFYVGKHVEYDNVYVMPGYRGKGVGKKMMKFVDYYAREQGCVAVELDCDILDKGNRKFWEKLGFEQIGHYYQKSLIGS